MIALALFTLIPFLIGSGMVIAKLDSQRAHDKDHKTYRLLFPKDLSEKQVADWIKAISGTLRPRTLHLSGSPTIVFETWSTPEKVVHRLKVPWQHAGFISGQLNGHIPGIRVIDEDEFPRLEWTRIVEIGLVGDHRPLRIDQGQLDQMSTTILRSMREVKGDEALVVQWVMTPAIPTHLPIYKEAQSLEFRVNHLWGGPEASKDEINDRRDKLSEQNMMAVLRVGALASTPTRADHLIANIRQALASTRAPGHRFVRRLLRPSTLQSRLELAKGTLKFPIQLSITEVAGLIAWPMNSPNVSGLPRPLGRQYAPPTIPLSQDVLLGHSLFQGHERPVGVGFNEMLLHGQVVGTTGTGKSALLAHIARQVMNAGLGLIVMETEGNLYQAVLDYIPSHRVNDVALLDISDKEFPVGLNFLDQGHASSVADEIIDIFAHKYGARLWADEFLLHGMQTLAENPLLTLMDLIPLLSPTADDIPWLDSITRSIKDPELKRWWQLHENRGKYEQQRRADPVLSRISQLASRPELRYMMGQSKSSFQMSDILAQDKILLINLKGVSRETASLAGTLIMNAIRNAAVSLKQKTKPTVLLLDEFADFMDLPVDFAGMLAQMRKRGLSMWMAHQYMTQLKPSMRDGMANARNKVVLQSNAEDGRLMSRELHGAVEAEDITDLQAYEAIASVMTPSGSSGPISINTEAPVRSTGNAGWVRRLSREKYGRPLKDVIADMDKRRMVEKPTSRRPRISGEGWGV